jgi:2-hydroxy-3-keto-5-methylthiopentenyl-1-phosphate phosphatase
MLPVGAIVVDFDGTVCLHDVGVDMLARFGSDGSRDGDLDGIDRAFEGGAGLRDVILAEAATLRADDEELIAFALEHCPLDPTFAGFAAWAADEGVLLTVVSDGSGSTWSRSSTRPGWDISP